MPPKKRLPEAPQPAAPPASPPPETWADRGWWLAVEYGVLARDKFLKRLPRIRELGAFKELLEPGGAILYRNLFRADQVQAAWELLTVLRPWQEQLVLYLNGEQLGLREAEEVLWCAGFLQRERPCRGTSALKGSRPAGCEGGRVLLGAGRWDERGDGERHALTFAAVDAQGLLRFDREDLARWAARGRNRRCPGSPARDPAAFAAAFQDVPVRDLDWPLVAELSPELRARLGEPALAAEHGFVLKKGQPDLDAHAPLELRAAGGGEVEVRRADAPGGGSIARQVRLPERVRAALREGTRLRGVRIEEAWVKLGEDDYDREQRFVLSARVRLGPGDRTDLFRGWTLSTAPRATPEWNAWADRACGNLP